MVGKRPHWPTRSRARPTSRSRWRHTTVLMQEVGQVRGKRSSGHLRVTAVRPLPAELLAALHAGKPGVKAQPRHRATAIWPPEWQKPLENRAAIMEREAKPSQPDAEQVVDLAGSSGGRARLGHDPRRALALENLPLRVPIT